MGWARAWSDDTIYSYADCVYSLMRHPGYFVFLEVAMRVNGHEITQLANLGGANLRGAELRGANLRDVKYNKKTIWPFKGLVTNDD